MSSAHRTNVLVTSCLKSPVDPRTRAPLASYERERVLPATVLPAVLPSAPRDDEDEDLENWFCVCSQLEFEECGSDFYDEDYLTSRGPVVNLRASGDRIDLSKIFFSNEEYYTKLEELKKAHLRTMAELESMYRRKLQLKSSEPLDGEAREAAHRTHWSNSGPSASHRLRKSHSAVELRYGLSDSSDDEDDDVDVSNADKYLQFSPKEHIKNMWLDFKLSPTRRLSSSSLRSLDRTDGKTPRRKKKRRHRATVPRPFQMMLREEERRKRGIKTRSEMEHENAELRRQLEDLTECQRKFRASPVPAHIHLPLFEELQEKSEERRKATREEHHLKSLQKPFSFLERERLKKEQRQQRKASPPDRDEIKPFKAKPVPKSVYAAAAGDQMKEEQLYRSIKMQLRAQEMLSSAAMPPSMLSRRLAERKKSKNEDSDCTYQPKINKDVPDFDASYRRFKKRLEKRKEVKPTTSCEPFELKTSQISSHRDRILAEIEKEQSSPKALRWPYSPEPPRHTPTSSLCSSLSGSTELLPSKSTSAARKRQEAVRKALEQRRKADAEEDQWREKQRRREKRLQTTVVKRAQANDPHTSLSQTQPSKLKEFRKMDLQRKKEYEQEIKEMKQRVKGRPLLLEQVAQRNAKQAAEKRYTEALQGCDVTEDFISQNAAKSSSSRKPSSSDSKVRYSRTLSSTYSSSYTVTHVVIINEQDEPDMGYKPALFRKLHLKDEGGESEPNQAEVSQKDSEDEQSVHPDEEPESDENYSDDHEEYSDDSGRDESKDEEEP
ncbi:protein FAM161A [Eucyclogobius newberryi]|uniref:protein FAM161A n=1 Tax=Eucyclogobius newberryi TaxID=166745 RepID=UPI003B5A0DC0